MRMTDGSAKSWLAFEQAPAGVIVGATTRQGGESVGGYAAYNLAGHVGDDPVRVEHNRSKLKAQLDAHGIQWLQQIHGVDCVCATPQSLSDVPAADAVWTAHRRLALAIMTADCVPVLLWDTAGEVIGAAHAGWQGLVEGVLDSLLSQMPVPAHRLEAWIGPCISADRYEVGADVWVHFEANTSEVLRPHPHVPDKRLLDLAAAAQQQLAAAGVSKVVQSGLCAFTDERFYSHRRARGQPTGRMASIVMLK
jgi:YfiH family protein